MKATVVTLTPEAELSLARRVAAEVAKLMLGKPPANDIITSGEESEEALLMDPQKRRLDARQAVRAMRQRQAKKAS